MKQTDPIKMRVYTIVFALLVAFVASMAAENGPLMAALQPVPVDDTEVMVVQPQGVREKRSALLGAGLIGAGALGLGAAGLVGAGLVGAKAGFVGGALAGGLLSHGRSYGGGYGGYGGYYSGGYGGHYGGYGGYGYGGHGRVYRKVYLVEEPWC